MSDDLFADHEDEGLEEFGELREELFELLSEFMDEHELSEAWMSALLIEAAATMHQVDYFMTTAKPSEGGLKISLDRFQRTLADLVRSMKKNAREALLNFEETLKDDPEARAAMQDLGDEGGDGSQKP